MLANIVSEPTSPQTNDEVNACPKTPRTRVTAPIYQETRWKARKPRRPVTALQGFYPEGSRCVLYVFG